MNFIKLSLSCLFAGLMELDSVQVAQMMLSRPIITAMILGYFNGCVMEALQMGFLVEIIFLDFMPIGGVVPPNGIMAASVSVLMFKYSGINPSMAFFLGIFSALIYSKIEFDIRAFRSKWNVKIENRIQQNKYSIKLWIAASLVFETLIVSIFIMCMVIIISSLVKIFNLTNLYRITDLAYSLMPWLGLAVLCLKFRTQVQKLENRK